MEIDNEMLRDQVQHLQMKIGTLEDTLEDVRTANEHEYANASSGIRSARKSLARNSRRVGSVYTSWWKPWTPDITKPSTPLSR